MDKRMSVFSPGAYKSWPVSIRSATEGGPKEARTLLVRRGGRALESFLKNVRPKWPIHFGRAMIDPERNACSQQPSHSRARLSSCFYDAGQATPGFEQRRRPKAASHFV